MPPKVTDPYEPQQPTVRAMKAFGIGSGFAAIYFCWNDMMIAFLIAMLISLGISIIDWILCGTIKGSATQPIDQPVDPVRPGSDRIPPRAT